MLKSKTVLNIESSKSNSRNSEGSFFQMADGRIAFYYTRYTATGHNDNDPADIAVRYSFDSGETWTDDILAVQGPADGNVMSVSLLRLADSRIMLSYLVKRKMPDGVVDCRPVARFSSDEGATWTDPQYCIATPGYFVVNNDRLVQLKTGRILLPSAFTCYVNHAAIDFIYYSDDAGATWQASEWILPPADQKALWCGLQEPGVIELSSGRLMCWARTDYGFQYKSFSDDGGKSWTPTVPALEFPSPCSPLSIKRDPGSGRLIAVWNDLSDRWGVSLEKTRWDSERCRLVMAFSSDDGATWTDHELIESDPECGYCYTAIEFLPDRSFLLAYCCGGHGKICLQDLRIRKFYL